MTAGFEAKGFLLGLKTSTYRRCRLKASNRGSSESPDAPDQTEEEPLTEMLVVASGGSSILVIRGMTFCLGSCQVAYPICT
jgi:hypothetical protein